MSRRSDEYMRGVPMKPYDLVREGVMALGAVAVIVIVLAIILGSPYSPTVRGEDVAKDHPLDFLKASTDFLSGESGLQTYGPPYTKDTDNLMKVFGFAPATILGVTKPIDAQKDLVISPLERVAVLNKDVAAALAAWKAASEDKQKAWTKAYSDGLDKAEEANGEVKVAAGDYGPVPVMMYGMLALARAGLLEGALTSSERLPYNLDNTKAMLFFQEGPDSDLAATLDMEGDQWGITHEVGNLPGPWWLWPYAIWYQIPLFAKNPNADLIVGLMMLALFLILFLMPFIPILNKLPRWIGFYRIVWRDWYARQQGSGGKARK
jgi:hypothetical protein